MIFIQQAQKHVNKYIPLQQDTNVHLEIYHRFSATYTCIQVNMIIPWAIALLFGLSFSSQWVI